MRLGSKNDTQTTGERPQRQSHRLRCDREGGGHLDPPLDVGGPRRKDTINPAFLGEAHPDRHEER